MMIRNYFFLNRFIKEVSPQLIESRLVDVFSQEKDKLILAFKKNEHVSFIEINTNPGKPYITLKKSFHRAKRNTLNFFAGYINSECTGISIAESDRLIKISLSNAVIYFAIRGKYTNVILTDKENNSDSFKKNESDYIDSFLAEVKKIKFTEELNHPGLENEYISDFFEQVRKKYPHIGKEIINEYKIRAEKDKDKTALLNTVILEALNNRPQVVINNRTFEVLLLPSGFHYEKDGEVKSFDSVIDAFKYFIHKSDQIDEIKNKFRIVDKHISKELSRLSTKLNNLAAQLEKGSREVEYSKIGNLLLINMKSIKKGFSELETADIYDNNNIIKIKLEPKLSPEQNSSRYFEKARNDRINRTKSQQLYKESETKYLKLKSIKAKLDSNPSLTEIDDIMDELKIKYKDQPEQKEDLSKKFKHYNLNNKYHIYVGKDSKNNDLLTTRFAKQNDFWFHARSVSGSHVILRVENTKESVPKDVLKKVASLAAYHSKAKTAGVVPVSYCFKKYVVKKKGMPVGQVALLKEETLLVRPEIPDGFEFIIND